MAKKKTSKQNFLIEFWNNLPNPVKIILVLLALYIAYKIFLAIQAKLRYEKQQSVLNNSTFNVQNADGSTSSVNLGQKATEIHEKWNIPLVLGSFWGTQEDEQGAMDILNSVPNQLIPQLSKTYYDLFQSDLKSDFQKYLSNSQWESIKYKFS